MCIADRRRGRRIVTRKLKPRLANSFFTDTLINNSTAARPVLPVSVTVHVRVDGLLGGSGHPQRVPSVDADGSVAGRSPQFCASQLGSQNLAAHATVWHYAGYASSGILPTGRKTCAYGKAGSQSAQTDEQHQSGRLKLSSAHMVAFNDGTNAQKAGVTFASFLYSNRSRFTADICLSGSRNFNWKSN